jgi:hypothetical protein
VFRRPGSEWADLDCLTWVFSYYFEENYRQLEEAESARLRGFFENARMVSGHFQHGLHRIGHRGTFAYVTTIRDPVSRVVSWWNWNLQLGRMESKPFNVTFDEFLYGNLPYGGFQKDNHMVRVLCNNGTGSRNGAKYGDDTPLTLLADVTEEHYECALRHLRRDFALVFVSEQMDDVIELAPTVSRLFNMRTPSVSEGKTYNPTTYQADSGMVRSSELSDEQRQRILDLNKWDVLLYEQAGALHNVSIARLGALKQKLAAESAVV